MSKKENFLFAKLPYYNSETEEFGTFISVVKECGNYEGEVFKVSTNVEIENGKSIFPTYIVSKSDLETSWDKAKSRWKGHNIAFPPIKIKDGHMIFKTL